MGLMLGHRNHADAATLSLGSWSAEFPLANMQSLPIKRPARTTTLPAFSQQTLFMADIGAGKVVDMFCLFGLGVPAGTEIYIIATNSPALSSTALYSSAVGSSTYVGPKVPTFVLPVPSVEARYWFLLAILPTATTIDIGRLYIGEAWQPESGYDWGSQVGVESTTQVQSSLSGVDYYDSRPSKRTKQVKFSWLSEVDAYQGALEIQRRLDVSGEVVVVDDDLIKPDLCGGSWADLGPWQEDGASIATEVKGDLWTPNGRFAPTVLMVDPDPLSLHGLTAQPYAHAYNQKFTLLCAVRRRTHALYCALRLSTSSHFVNTTRVVFSYADGSIASQIVAPGWVISNKLSKKLNDAWYLIGMSVVAPYVTTNFRIFASLNIMEAANGPDEYTPAVSGHSMYYSGLSVFEGDRVSLYPGIEQHETYLARMRQLTPIDNPYVDTYGAAFEFVEVL